jgi:hypothetical protein
MPEIYKTVLLLRDVEELTTEETAEVLDIATDTVKTRLHRARLAVRRDLDDFIQVARSPNRPRCCIIRSRTPWRVHRPNTPTARIYSPF